jgi:hypothetical protein
MTRLSVLCPTRDRGERVRVLLEPLRDGADEIVVLADSRVDAADLAEYGAVADRLVRFEVGPSHSSLAWAVAQCRGDWVLLLAGDEVPGRELIAALPELIESRDALQYSFSLRWLWPDETRWLAGEPWYPDFQSRLLRHDAALRFYGRKHELARFVLPHRFCDLPIWHLNLLLLDVDERREKVALNVAERPGLTAPGGGELNTSYYVPEDAPSAPTSAVPAEDLERVRRVLAAEPQPAPAVSPPLATRAEIEPLWADREPRPDAFAATITPLLDGPVRVRPGEPRTIYVRVRNDGSERWPWGLDQPPLFRLGFRWQPEHPEARAPFPCEIGPGEERIVPVTFTAPEREGTWRLELDVLLEDVRWFGSPCVLDVDVG